MSSVKGFQALCNSLSITLNVITHYGKAIAAAGLVLGLVACGGGGGGGGAAAPAVTLSSIEIIPASATIAKGDTANLTATGTFSDNSTADITTQVTWESASPTIASLGANPGVVTGVAIGTTTVTAALSGVTSPVANITVTSATLASIAVTPASISIAKGTTTIFTAIGTYTDGTTTGNISGSVTWIPSNTAVTSVTASGIAKGEGVGTSSITASKSGKTSNAVTLTVTAPVVTSIAITPSAPGVTVGATVNLIATATYSDTTFADITTSATWLSADTAVANIGPNTGVATGVAAGSSVITAAASGVTSPGVTLTVTLPTCTWDISTWDNCLWGS